MVRRLLEELTPEPRRKFDRCYVHNFARPRSATADYIGSRKARAFRRRVRELGRLHCQPSARSVRCRTGVVRTQSDPGVDSAPGFHEITAPLEVDLKKSDMALVSVQSGPIAQTAIFPLVDGKPVQPDQFNQLVAEGKISPQRKEQVQSSFPEFQSRVQAVGREVGAVYRTGGEQLHGANERASATVAQ